MYQNIEKKIKRVKHHTKREKRQSKRVFFK